MLAIIFEHVKAWYLRRLYLRLQRIEEQAAFAGHGIAISPRIPVWRGDGVRLDLATHLSTLSANCILPARRLLAALHASRRLQAGLLLARYRHLGNEIESHVAAGPILARWPAARTSFRQCSLIAAVAVIPLTVIGNPNCLVVVGSTIMRAFNTNLE
jgi:hypothetical protein